MPTNRDDFRPLVAPAYAGNFAVCLRQGALQCARCNQAFRQYEAQEFDGGIRFICSGCGLDALEVTPA